MHSFKNYYIFILAMPLLISCASKNYLISTDYAGKKITGAELIVPTVDEVRFRQFAPVFTESEVEKIKTNFSILLSNELKNALSSNSTFADVRYASFKEKPDFESKAFDINPKTHITINLPAKSLESGTKNLFILFMEDITLSVINEDEDTSDPAKHYSVQTNPGSEGVMSNLKYSKKTFLIEWKYSIFDNDSGKIVSVGKFSSKQKYNETSIVENIITAGINKFAREVFQDTPFQND